MAESYVSHNGFMTVRQAWPDAQSLFPIIGPIEIWDSRRRRVLVRITEEVTFFSGTAMDACLGWNDADTCVALLVVSEVQNPVMSADNTSVIVINVKQKAITQWLKLDVLFPEIRWNDTQTGVEIVPPAPEVVEPEPALLSSVSPEFFEKPQEDVTEEEAQSAPQPHEAMPDQYLQDDSPSDAEVLPEEKSGEQLPAAEEEKPATVMPVEMTFIDALVQEEDKEDTPVEEKEPSPMPVMMPDVLPFILDEPDDEPVPEEAKPETPPAEDNSQPVTQDEPAAVAEVQLPTAPRPLPVSSSVQRVDVRNYLDFSCEDDIEDEPWSSKELFAELPLHTLKLAGVAILLLLVLLFFLLRWLPKC